MARSTPKVGLLVIAMRLRRNPPGSERFRTRQGIVMKVNLLANYGWEWDLAGLKNGAVRSGDISRLDLIVRWGGDRRLSGFLPAQSVYADF